MLLICTSLVAIVYGCKERRNATGKAEKMGYVREKGRDIFQEVYGEAAINGLKAYVDFDDFVVETAKRTTDFVSGTVRAHDVR